MACIAFVFACCFLFICYLARKCRVVEAAPVLEQETEGIISDDIAHTENNMEQNIVVTNTQLQALVETRIRELLAGGTSSSYIPFVRNGDERDVTASNPLNQVAHVVFKAPQPLYKQNPETWFAILEQQFAVSGIKTEKTMYAHAVGALDAHLHNQFAHLITRDKGNKPYSVFKQEVIRVLGESEKSKLNKILHGLTLGDKKPSQLLEEFQANASGFSAISIKQLWMQRLPSQIQLILTPFEHDLDIKTLAERADDLVETLTGSFNQIAGVTHKSGMEDAIRERSKEVDIQQIMQSFKKDILAEVAEIVQRQNPSDHNSRNFNRQSSNRRRSKSRDQSKKRDLCYYHFKFGDKAQKCVSGCKMHNTFLEKSNF